MIGAGSIRHIREWAFPFVQMVIVIGRLIIEVWGLVPDIGRRDLIHRWGCDQLPAPDRVPVVQGAGIEPIVRALPEIADQPRQLPVEVDQWGAVTPSASPGTSSPEAGSAPVIWASTQAPVW